VSNKIVIAFLGGVLLLLSSLEAAAQSPRFLSSPFKDADIRVQQGWYYSDGRIHKPNGGIDYVKGSTASSSWESFDVVAAADGVAVWDDDPNSGYGNVVLIRHDQADAQGRAYFTLYAHCQDGTVDPSIPKLGRKNREYQKWKHVLRGDFLGKAGSTGYNECSDKNKCIHLHFQVFVGGYYQNNKDPYDIRKKANFYSGDCGPNFLWEACPPIALPLGNGWRMDRFNSARTNLTPAKGPQTEPQFNILIPDVPEQLTRINDWSDLVLQAGNTVSSYTANGQFKWRRTLGDNVFDVAIATNGTVYASTAGTVSALGKDTGTPVWPSVGTNNGNESSPLAIGTGGTIYFLSGASYVGSDPPNITAINPDGTKKFTTTADFGFGRGNQGILMNNETTAIYLLGYPTNTLMLSAVTGDLVKTTNQCNSRGPTVFTPFNTLYSNDGDTNLVEFSSSLSSCVQIPVGDSILSAFFGITPSNTMVVGDGGRLTAIDRQGHTLWTTTERFTQGFIDGNGTIYSKVLGDEGIESAYPSNLAAINGQTGQVLWRKHFDQQILSFLLGGNGKLYVSTGDVNSNLLHRKLYVSVQ
jgi:hypothetical protein